MNGNGRTQDACDTMNSSRLGISNIERSTLNIEVTAGQRRESEDQRTEDRGQKTEDRGQRQIDGERTKAATAIAERDIRNTFNP